MNHNLKVQLMKATSPATINSYFKEIRMPPSSIRIQFAMEHVHPFDNPQVTL